MTYEELELNGCYAMLCEALRAWHRIQHDHTREIAAKTLKDVYGYEFHLNGGGCSWRLPETDHEWAVNGMRALGLPADKFEENALVLARLLDGQAKDYEMVSGLTLTSSPRFKPGDSSYCFAVGEVLVSKRPPRIRVQRFRWSYVPVRPGCRPRPTGFPT